MQRRIRIQAHGRVPFGGQITGAVHGLPGLVPCAGPLAHSLDDMALFISTVLDARPDRYDAAAHAGPWQRSLDASPPAKVTIGIVSEDEHFPLHPPVRRALASAVDALTRAGHSIVRLANSPDRSISYGSRLAFQYFNYAPRVVDHIAAGREPPVASVAHRYHPMFSGPPPVSQDLETFEKMAALHTARDKYQDAWRQAWVDNDIDVFLAPAAQNTAVAHDTYGWAPYTLLWNLLDVMSPLFYFGSVLWLSVLPFLNHET